MRRVFFGIVVLVAAMPAATASAASVDLKFDGMAFGTSSLTARSNVTGQLTFYAGAMTWSEAGNRDNTLTTFCTEVTQAVSSSVTTYDLTEIGLAPSRSPGMGSYRAGLMQNLYDTYGSQALASRTESAAFQLAVWEIAYEAGVAEDAGYDLSVGIGSFRITGGSVMSQHDGFGMSATALANQWLSTLASVEVTNLVALTNRDAQDQIIVVPLPPAALLAGAGLAIAGISRRRWLRRVN